MKLVRPALAVAVGAGLVLSGTAGAATKKPVCNLVTDPAGDATGFVVTGLPLPNDATLDVLSADVATNAKKFGGIIRLSAVGKDSTSVLDTYYLNFSVNDTKYFVSAQYDGTTATFTAGDFTGTNGGRHSLGAIDGKVDPAAKTVSFSAPLSTWGFKGTAKVTGFDVLGQRYIGQDPVGGVTPTADEATSDATYTGSSPSCLKL